MECLVRAPSTDGRLSLFGHHDGGQVVPALSSRPMEGREGLESTPFLSQKDRRELFCVLMVMETEMCNLTPFFAARPWFNWQIGWGEIILTRFGKEKIWTTIIMCIRETNERCVVLTVKKMNHKGITMRCD